MLPEFSSAFSDKDVADMELALLRELVTLTADRTTPAQWFEAAFDLLAKLLPYDSGFALEFSKTAPHTVVLAKHNRLPPTFHTDLETFELPEGFIAVLETPESVARLELALAGLREILYRFHYGSPVFVPLTADGHVLGVLTLLNNPHPETRETWHMQRARAQTILTQTGFLMGAALQRARLAKELAQVQERHDSFVWNGLDAFWETDADLNLVYVNQAGLDLLGLDASDVIGKNVQQRLPKVIPLLPDDLATNQAFVQTLLRENQVSNVLVPITNTKQVIWLSVNARVRRDAQGTLLGIHASARDVTLQVKAQQELEQRTRELELLYELSMRLNKALDMHQALRDVLELVAKLLDADAVALGLIDEWAERFDLVAHHGVTDELVQAYTNLAYRRVALQPDFDPALAATTIEYLIASRRILTTQDFTENSRFNVDLARGFGFQSFLAFPMMFERHVYGMVFLSSTQPAHFDTRGTRLGASISAQLGLALHTHRLVAEHKRSAAYASALTQIGRRIQYAPRAEQALEGVARDIKNVLDADYVVIQLLRVDHFEVVTASDMRETARTHPIAGYERDIFETDSPLAVTDYDLPGVDPEQRKILRRLNLRAALSMRLYAHDHPLGILFVNQELPYEWRPEEVDFVRRVSQQIAYALENKRLLDESAKQLRIQRALENAARIIASVLEPEAALSSIADDLVQVFKVDYVGFHLLENDSLVLVAESGKTGAPRRLPISPHQHRILRELDTTVVYDRNTDNLPPTQFDILTRYGFLADIGAPLVVGNNAIGILYLSQRMSRAWTESEIRLAETFARQIALALQNVRLFRASQEQVRDLRALARSAHLIATSRSLPDVLPFIAGEFKRVLGADYVGFHLLEGNMLRVVTELNHPHNGERYELASYHRLILEHGQRIVIDDINADVRDEQQREKLRSFGLCADIAVALMSRNKPLGILFVSQKVPRLWHQSEVQLVETFASQIASVLDMVQVLNEKEARVRELEVLTEAYEFTAMNLDEAALVDLALMPLRSLLNADIVGVSLLEGDHLRPMRVLNGRSYGKDMPLTPLNRRIFETKQAIVFDTLNTAELSLEERTRLEFYGLRCGVSAPMILAGGPVGLLNLGFKTEHVFTDAEIRLVQAVANQLAMAFANARLLEQQQQRIERSAKLTNFAFFCNSVPDSMTLQKEVVRQICDMLNVQSASVRLVENGWLTSGASHGYRNASARAHPIAVDGMLAQIMQDETPFEIPDLARATELPAHWRERHLEEGFNAGLIVPMPVAGRVIGVLTLFHKQPHVWVKLETQYAQTIGSILALALANLEEKERVAHKSQELQATMNSVFSGVLTTDAEGIILSWNREAEKITGYPAAAMLGKRWDIDGPRVGVGQRDDTLILEAMSDRHARFGLATRHFTRADGQVITLREVATPLLDSSQNVRGAVGAFWDRMQEQAEEQRKIDFINEMAHQLNTKLGAVVISAQQLLRGGLHDKTRAQYTHVLSDTMQDLQEFQERLTAFELEHVENSPEEEQVRLRTLVDEQIALLRVREPRRRFRVDGTFDFVLADPARLQIVLENLLDNACKYSPPRSQISVLASCPSAGELVLKIHNKGAAIPEQVKPHLFERHRRGSDAVPGSGLGLWLVRTKLHEMGGEIDFTSHPRKGTTFFVTLRRKTHALPE